MDPAAKSEPSKTAKRVAPYRAVLYMLSVAIGLLGLELVLGSLPGTGTVDWDRDYSGAGVVLLAAALAAPSQRRRPPVSRSSALTTPNETAHNGSRKRPGTASSASERPQVSSTSDAMKPHS